MQGEQTNMGVWRKIEEADLELREGGVLEMKVIKPQRPITFASIVTLIENPRLKLFLINECDDFYDRPFLQN